MFDSRAYVRQPGGLCSTAGFMFNRRGYVRQARGVNKAKGTALGLMPKPRSVYGQHLYFSWLVNIPRAVTLVAYQ